MYCNQCGAKINGNFCSNCGTSVESYDRYDNNCEYSSKDWLITLLLCIFVGTLGIHRFYSGKIGTGILYLLTGGLVGIGWIVDLIFIACKKYKDKEGKFISKSTVC